MSSRVCVSSITPTNTSSPPPPPPPPQPEGVSPGGREAGGSHSYLRKYPYLFVRETDQTDYFCTLCESYLREDQLQSHLFDGHQAESATSGESFVRVLPTTTSQHRASTRTSRTESTESVDRLHICTVCWAKIPSPDDLTAHRSGCRIDPAEEELENGSVPVARRHHQEQQQSTVTSVVSTPDISNLLSVDQNSNDSSGMMNGEAGATVEKAATAAGAATTAAAPPPIGRRSRKKPPTHVINGLAASHQPQQPSPQLNTAAAAAAAAAVAFASQCLQCSLCSMVVPSPGYLVHLRDFHRITCSLEDSQCPLCLAPVPVLELSIHLAAGHGMVPQTAVNALLLWVLSSNCFLPPAPPPDTKKPLLSASGTHSSSPPNSNNNSHSLSSSTTATSISFALGARPSPNKQRKLDFQATLANHGNPPAPPPPPQQQQQPQQQQATSIFEPSSKLNTLLTSPQRTKLMSSGGLVNTNASQQQQQGHIPTVLQSLLSKQDQSNFTPSTPNLAFVSNIVSKFTRRLYGENGKESIQCLVCSKWFAVSPVKHLRTHMVAFEKEKRTVVPLIGGAHVCIICYDLFDSLHRANTHLYEKHDILVESMLSASTGNGGPDVTILNNNTPNGNSGSNLDDIPTVIDFPSQPQKGSAKNANNTVGKKVELDNAGRVKSGKVRKQCELCGEWSNIKWFFKHMSEVHQALFCRCCREYLPIREHEEHKRWHSEPPYMGQKIRIEAGQPVIIDRKERASLTPIGSLASWGGSSGGKVVKAVDVGLVPSAASGGKRKRKTAASAASAMTTAIEDKIQPAGEQQQQLVGHLDYGEPQAKVTAVKDTLMPKETCPVCGIQITYKNLARHIKLRHKIKYKFCHRCRKLVPSGGFDEHRASCNEIVIDGEPVVSNSEGAVEDAEEEEESNDDIVDPSQYLDASTNGEDIAAPDEEDDGNADALIIADDEEEEHEENAGDRETGEEESNISSLADSRKATTSKNKLESLMGKAFKHPRRRCTLCGYTVSYSNFKRHLRNAHPGRYRELAESDAGDVVASLSSEVIADEEEEEAGNQEGLIGHVVDEDEEEEEEEQKKKPTREDNHGFVECPHCGDHILSDFLDRHVIMNHGSDKVIDNGDAENADKSANASIEQNN